MEPTWTTGNNREIPISKREDDHLLNIYRYIIREGERFDMLKFIKHEINERGLNTSSINLCERWDGTRGERGLKKVAFNGIVNKSVILKNLIKNNTGA